MQPIETIKKFYARIQPNAFFDSISNMETGHFNVFKRDRLSLETPYCRKDYYKISLIIGEGELHYANKWIKVNKPALLFSNPIVPYSWETDSQEQLGWFCLFTNNFIQGNTFSSSLQSLPFFKIGGTPLFFLSEQQQRSISLIFQQMITEMESDYGHKYDILRTYLYLLIYEAMKINPAENATHYFHNTSERIASFFMELLEKQFPIEEMGRYPELRTAQDYARCLSLHVNSLNRHVKEVTGKTTTQLISSRVIQEANNLLKHTDWSISSIAYSLGFEDPAYFSKYFKKQTGVSPYLFRKA